MKKNIWEFIHRGLLSCGLGPVVLAIIYLMLHQFAGLETLTVEQACIGIFSLTALAFIAGGMNVLYEIERLPLMAAIFIHGSVLYISYLAVYLFNGWLQSGLLPILVFTAMFILGFIVIWVTVYLISIRNTKKINEILKKKQQNP